MTRIVTLVTLILYSLATYAQGRLLVYGKVTNAANEPLELVSVVQLNTLKGTTSDSYGNYEIEVVRRDSITIIFSRMGSEKVTKTINPTSNAFELNVLMPDAVNTISEVSVSDESGQASSMQRIDPKYSRMVPNASGSNIEALIMTLPGVFSTNELSSQYSVRGGNFDENLVYVNDIEVYRPLLIRSGQQEGLSFINSEMVASVAFSSGGFEARYGDKMSSVLDIRYKRPNAFAASVSASLLGANANVEHASKNGRFTQLHGVRYKTSAYLLGSLDTKGEYNPAFFDYQTYMTYQLNPILELSFLGNISRNSYRFKPRDRQTKFGTYNIARALNVYFEGWENDLFQTATGALSLNIRPTQNSSYKVTASYYSTIEDEAYDILSEYWLNELDNQLGSATLGDSLENIGVGAALQHARNRLAATVSSVGFKGTHIAGKNIVNWGLNLQHETIDDHINEWEIRDSSGYSWPYNGNSVNLFKRYYTRNTISSNRFSGYFQDSYMFDKLNLSLTGGIRFSYWSLNDETIVSPRFSAIYSPRWKNRTIFKASAGLYYQAPFYKEIRDKEGNINTNIRSQKSIHYVTGVDYYFKSWERPFKFSAEAYYKKMTDLIPYDVDNVQIRYYGDNMSDGYATGLDMRIFGEFVPGVDSWISLSFMKTEEDIRNDFYLAENEDGTLLKIYPGYVPRPTDQAYNLSIFFQDYFPGNPNYKAHLKVIYGAPIPFGPPNGEKYYMGKFRSPNYTRVDMGLSKIINQNKNSRLLKNFKEIWLGIDIFNMFDINNVNSYFWVPDVYGNTFAVPNYLTGRRFNFSVTARF